MSAGPNFRAVRAFNKAVASSAALEAQREAEQADAEFDGGEWSFGFHAEASAEIYERIARQVERAFGLPENSMHWHMGMAGDIAAAHWCRAVSGDRR